MSEERLPKYFQEYLDEKFKRVEELFRTLKGDVDTTLRRQDKLIEEHGVRWDKELEDHKELVLESLKGHKEEMAKAFNNHADKTKRHLKIMQYSVIGLAVFGSFVWIQESRQFIIEFVKSLIF